MDMIDLIAHKRKGHVLSTDQIEWIVTQYVKETVPDYQMSALLMAIYFQGMNRQEVLDLTRAMVYSGDTINLSDIPGIKVDKHSTGGVGDKVSLVLAPLVAAAGIPVPMMSGRGLGHTGGTLDKLEAIPGFETQLSKDKFIKQVMKIGFAMLGQTENICPADRKIYALRDATATVPSLPLICSSIISKKKAEGANALVLDVKAGKGAIFETKEEALILGKALVELGNDFDLKTVALFTTMDQPLGHTVGNWLETREAIDVLRGGGPSDLIEVVVAFGGVMLYSGEQTKSIQAGMHEIRSCIDSGAGYQKFLDMVEMQGGDLSFIENPDTYSKSTCQVVVESPENGYVTKINARVIGLISVDLGAGRLKKEDTIDYRAGIVIHKKIGHEIKMGEPLATLYTEKNNTIETAKQKCIGAFDFGHQKVRESQIIDTYLTLTDETPFGEILADQ